MHGSAGTCSTANHVPEQTEWSFNAGQHACSSKPHIARPRTIAEMQDVVQHYNIVRAVGTGEMVLACPPSRRECGAVCWPVPRRQVELLLCWTHVRHDLQCNVLPAGHSWNSALFCPGDKKGQTSVGLVTTELDSLSPL